MEDENPSRPLYSIPSKHPCPSDSVFVEETVSFLFILQIWEPLFFFAPTIVFKPVMLCPLLHLPLDHKQTLIPTPTLARIAAGGSTTEIAPAWW